MDFSKASDTVSQNPSRQMYSIQMNNSLGEWLVMGQSQSCTEWGDIRLGSLHMQGPAGLHPLPTFLQHFINDLDTGLEGVLIKFANSTELGGAVDS